MGVKIGAEVVSSLQGIRDANQKVNELVEEVSTATEEQAKGLDQVNIAVSQLNQVSQNIAASAEENSSIVEVLASLASNTNHVAKTIDQMVNGGRGTSETLEELPEEPRSLRVRIAQDQTEKFSTQAGFRELNQQDFRDPGPREVRQIGE